MYYRDWLNDKVVIDTDWPLSLGWKLSFYSSNKNFVDKKFYVKKKDIKKAFQSDKDFSDSEAYATAWNHKRVRAIGVFYQGNSTIRFIELVAHEVSHIVDYVFETAYIKLVDTELRAYMIDWMVGKILMRTKINTTAISKSKILRHKRSKKLEKLKDKLVKKLNLKHSGELYTLVTAKDIRDTKIKNIELFFKETKKIKKEIK